MCVRKRERETENFHTCAAYEIVVLLAICIYMPPACKTPVAKNGREVAVSGV